MRIIILMNKNKVFGVGKETFFLTCIGQTICAMGQPFIQNSPVPLLFYLSIFLLSLFV